jgi:putative ABC transport system substrate-binding protein
MGLASASGWVPKVEALRMGLRDLGYVEGKNIVIEFRWADGNYDRLPELAAELVGLNVDVIVTHATPGIRAAKDATRSVPIVMAATGDAVRSKVVDSLARPGGNVTGSSFFGPELAAKRVEVLKETLPRLRRAALLFNADIGGRGSVDAAIAAGKSLNINVDAMGVRGPGDFESAFATMASRRIDSVLINEDPMLVANPRGIGDLATKGKLPSIGFVEIAESGGLLAYAANIVEMHRRAAVFIDKILKGARPAEIPVEQPVKFEFVVNLKTAKQIGVTIPQWTLTKADKVIR